METPDGTDAVTHLNCSSCGEINGILDVATSSYKLFKLALSISSKDDHRQTFNVTKWLSCHLLN